MTTVLPTAGAHFRDDVPQAPAKNYAHRWRLRRGGIVNVWFYYDETFDIAGGRVIWRGTNGAGKSRALEMLLPFLLDADRRNIDATGAKKVRLEDLMKVGGAEVGTNRVGYLWLELEGRDDDGAAEYLTLGSFIRFSKSTAEAKAWYFITPLRVGHDLPLIDDTRQPLSRDQLADLIGADQITDRAETHRERVRTQVFGLIGESGRDRYAGLLQLLHVLRNPDVGNRIEAGLLPTIVAEALPPLSETALTSAGQQLDALSETRATQRALERSAAHVATFLDAYRRYASGELSAAGEAAREGASSLSRLTSEARDADDKLAGLQQRHADTAADLAVLSGRAQDLEGTVNGIRASQAFADAAELDAVEHKVAAQRRTAEQSCDRAAGARVAESERVADADGRAEEAVNTAVTAADGLRMTRDRLTDAGMSTDALPAEVAVVFGATPPLAEAVLVDCDHGPVPVDRPQPRPVEVAPGDPTTAASAVGAVRQATMARAASAGNRLATAQSLRSQMRVVERAESDAEDAARRAEDATAEAEDAAMVRDDAATALATAWRGWVTDPATVTALGDVDWATTTVGPLLADVTTLAGEVDEDVPAPSGDGTLPTLAELDRAADDAAGPARQHNADRRAEINSEQRAANRLRTDLESEADDLRREKDPSPAAPPWQTSIPVGGVPLWQAVDFADPALTDDDRAGLEGALHAAGLLTAHLTADGTVTADDGQVLVTATGPSTPTSLAGVLTVDERCPLDPATVTSVLERVAIGNPNHPVWVAFDGRWGTGPLTGRRNPATARHIGAAARAAARTARLTEIAAELVELSTATTARAETLRSLQHQAAALDARLRTAPRSAGLDKARGLAAAAQVRSAKAATAVTSARSRAGQLRQAWHADHSRHVDACRSAGLPTGVEELRAMQLAATTAAESCKQLSVRLGELAAALTRHAAATGAAGRVGDERRAAEAAAERLIAEWRTAAAEYAALRESVGAEVSAVRLRLRTAETELEQVKTDLAAARAAEGDLGRQAAAAAVEVDGAYQRTAAARSVLADRLARLHRIVALPGITAAGLADGRQVPQLPPADPVTVDPTAVEAAVRALAAAVPARGAAVEMTTVSRAANNLDRDLLSSFDVLTTVTENVLLVDLVDAAGTHTVADAHAALQRQLADGRVALTERERTVFTQFVLGGVADELAQRLRQADGLVKAMNRSLSAIRTSHGIGVQVKWEMAVEQDPSLARLRSLVALAGEVRTEAQNDELIDLITKRVDEQLTLDATAGYAAHLKAALDYRAWHTVEVIIHGPGAQTRRISRRSKLSQGETRFVSYVTLFAAVDAYLSGLPDTTRALRLIVLDDAFAKVDDPTIGELMGLLVHLDIDFAMTGHGLWGTYPQVRQLDIYQVQRQEGTAAITTHFFWDGHTKHLRSAT
ncbi:TIGR02680 family protein [Modestobacter sp. VKM Ac-2979]|uniref:TIGR02680 family protein n=1 Tax=unclassified Modestobacter TaxID=2643866 RepID=UPI0022AB757C|nr:MULTISPECIES: TIGR02680 family protein [unclassified Modestobacter]MCZ2810119.1 TIGR02680 family protein [Modestobacter sp. VKM Ac-2979]MCZ2841605.1 TIGR02680 family protein [Modestobacter sp. VKM Ac-2980]